MARRRVCRAYEQGQRAYPAWVGPAFITDTVDGARATLHRYATATANDGARIYGLWDEGKIVGGVMFVAFDPIWGICEIGCWLEPDAVGGGLITRSVELLMEWAFLERGMSRVNGGAAPTTTAASLSRNDCACARRAFFAAAGSTTEIGTTRKYFQYSAPNGSAQDLIPPPNRRRPGDGAVRLSLWSRNRLTMNC